MEKDVTTVKKMDQTKVVSSIAGAIGENLLDDVVPWNIWKAKFSRLCAMQGIDLEDAGAFGVINAVIERTVRPGSSVAVVIESHALREKDSYSLAGRGPGGAFQDGE